MTHKELPKVNDDFVEGNEGKRQEAARQRKWRAYRCYQTTWQTYTQHVYCASSWAWNARA